MAVYDVSVALRPGMPTYAGEPGPRLDFPSRMARGDSANVSVLSLGSHTGTHVDAPHHFLDGASTVEALPLDALVGPAHVMEHTGPTTSRRPTWRALGCPQTSGASSSRPPMAAFGMTPSFTVTLSPSPAMPPPGCSSAELSWSASTTSPSSGSARLLTRCTSSFWRREWSSWRGWICGVWRRAPTSWSAPP